MQPGVATRSGLDAGMSTTGTPIGGLPAELLGRIFAVLATGEVRTRMLVCSWWKNVAYPRLFSRVRVITLQFSARYSSNFARFAESTHLHVFVRQLHLFYDNGAELEVRALGRLLAQLPRLCSLRIYADTIVYEADDDSNAPALPRLHLVKFSASVNCVMKEDSLHALFGLFQSIDEFLVDYGLLITLSPRPLPCKLRVRRLTACNNPKRSSVPLTPSEKVSLLSRIVDTRWTESICDPASDFIASAGRVQGASWPNLKELILGSNYETAIVIASAVYPSLKSLHLGWVVVNAPQRGSAPSSRRWTVLAETLLKSPLSLEEFSLDILLLGVDELDFEDEEYRPFDLGSIVRALQDLESIFVTTIESHPLLHSGKITVHIQPGVCQTPSAQIVDALALSVPPAHLDRLCTAKILCFTVEESW